MKCRSKLLLATAVLMGSVASVSASVSVTNASFENPAVAAGGV
jgi:hypothetical protein